MISWIPNFNKLDNNFDDTMDSKNINPIHTDVELSTVGDMLMVGSLGFKDPETVIKLIPKFEKPLGGDFKLKLAAICSLSMISVSNPRIIEGIMPKVAKLLDDQDWRIRKNVLDLMGNIGLVCFDMVKKYIDKIVSRLEDANPNVVCSAAYSLAKITLNPECKSKFQLMDKITKRIMIKSVLMEVLKNISEVNPKLVERYSEDMFSCLDDKNPIIKINALKILGNIENIDIDEERAHKIICNLNDDSLELRTSAAYAIWKLSKNKPYYFKSSMDKLIKNLNLESSESKMIKVYSLFALGRLCFLEPKKFETRLNINNLLNEDDDIRKPAVYLLHNLSMVDPEIIVKNIDMIYNLLNEGDYWIVRHALKIIGNVGMYDQKYVSRYLEDIKEKLNDFNLSQEAALTLIKSGFIEKEVLKVVLESLNDIGSNLKFLKRVIEYYPQELLEDLYREIRKRKNSLNNIYVDELTKFINEKKKEWKKEGSSMGRKIRIDLKDSEKPSVVVAMKSECSEVELEDGRVVYILPKDKCMEVSLSKELLELIERENEDEFEIYKLSHEIMIKSLIEGILMNRKV
ncbi:MAG: hypothetical protein PWP15_761 [Methanothermococcus sp.]|jgi:vesicle coat complex subunit|uniref:hypothetical protein n=1 Tax=Methanothermococcus TaxID=155862 RepID=UPI000377ADC7|nr:MULTISPECIES: hypothetical protein [Methanothermococcus]MDK2790254.1 hypothetical protein [Methanothermococcus sp.]MDK2987639.1 hypothetical protein [Methanothermococcus sp.]